ncbi:MAG TPA: O-acetyl-ADP-ribose deacetylase [bacterium]|nr:O-acetyl-ADP-ribose deacetylase [bacterium]
MPIDIVVGDITRISVGVIVNAANERMFGGGGVDGAIHAAAGPELLAACRALPEIRPGVRCPTGQARITPAFRLPARFVVHTVGPVWRGGDAGEAESLARCYRSSLALAVENGAASIAFPAISTGVFGYPPEKAAAVAVRECSRFLNANPSFHRVVLAAFREADASVLRAELARGSAGT